jgi:hypothetical protein
MEENDISKENKVVILKSIITANNKLFLKLKTEFQNLNNNQVYTVFLFKLGYTINEIKIVLGVSTSSIEDTLFLVKLKNLK